jgi:hypothetical protein
LAKVWSSLEKKPRDKFQEELTNGWLAVFNPNAETVDQALRGSGNSELVGFEAIRWEEILKRINGSRIVNLLPQRRRDFLSSQSPRISDSESSRPQPAGSAGNCHDALLQPRHVQRSEKIILQKKGLSIEAHACMGFAYNSLCSSASAPEAYESKPSLRPHFLGHISLVVCLSSPS